MLSGPKVSGTKVGGRNDGDTTVYIDFGTIRKKNNKVKMWNLYDFKTIQNNSANADRYLSAVIHSESDCEKKASRP